MILFPLRSIYWHPVTVHRQRAICCQVLRLNFCSGCGSIPAWSQWAHLYRGQHVGPMANQSFSVSQNSCCFSFDFICNFLEFFWAGNNSGGIEVFAHTEHGTYGTNMQLCWFSCLSLHLLWSRGPRLCQPLARSVLWKLDATCALASPNLYASPYNQIFNCVANGNFDQAW